MAVCYGTSNHGGTMPTSLIALITGANRGLGKETARQLGKLGHKVLIGSRNIENGQQAAEELAKEGMDAHVLQLDVTDPKQVINTAEMVKNEYGRCDILVNNAGVIITGDAQATLEHPSSIERISQTFNTNTMSAVRMCSAFLPLMRKNNYGRIVNLSSGLGQLEAMQSGWPAYRISKTAMNAVTKIVAAEVGDENIKINSVCPGWVQTDMGGAEASRTVEQGAEGIVWAATLGDEGPTGGFFRDKDSIPW